MNLNKWKVATGVLTLVIIVGASFTAGMFLSDNPAPTTSEASDTDETSSTPAEVAENPPEAVNNSKPQAEEVYVQAVDRGYQNVSVFIQKDGNIVIEYDTQATSQQQVKNEIQQLAVMFADIEGEPVSITIVTGNIQAVVPEPSVTAYRNDNLQEDAFEETIAYRNLSGDESNSDNN